MTDLQRWRITTDFAVDPLGGADVETVVDSIAARIRAELEVAPLAGELVVTIERDPPPIVGVDGRYVAAMLVAFEDLDAAGQVDHMREHGADDRTFNNQQMALPSGRGRWHDFKHEHDADHVHKPRRTGDVPPRDADERPELDVTDGDPGDWRADS